MNYLYLLLYLFMIISLSIKLNGKQVNTTMEINTIMLHVEALIFASSNPITIAELKDLLMQALEEEIEISLIETSLSAIEEKYQSEYFAFQIYEIGGGFQFLTKKQYHKTILTLNGDKHIKKLSASAMETLAIIAYKQPITKSDIEFIRGVSADYAIQKLLEKDLISIIGRDEDAIGKPLLYSASKNFFNYLGINSANQLPVLKDININLPVHIAEEDIIDDNTNLHVDSQGNLSL